MSRIGARKPGDVASPGSGRRTLLLALALGLLLGRPARAEVLSGSYTGNGTSNRSITGLGFRPDIVIVKGNTNRFAVISTSTMPADSTKEFLGGNLLADRIKSLDPDGFTLGADDEVNSNGPTYYWIAFKGIPGELKVGSYLGNSVDNRSIGGVGFRPDYVIVLPASSDPAFQRSSAMPGDMSSDFDMANNVSDHIQALQPDGFQVGTSDVNEGGSVYHYAAWRAIPGTMRVGSYVGDGTDDRSITGVGFLPEYVIHRRDGASTPHHKPRSTGPATDQNLHFTSLANDANNIQALEPDGFQVGTAVAVNAVGDTYYWMAFGDGPASDAVQFFTVTSTSAENFLEWLNPSIGAAYITTHIRYNAIAGSSACSFPATASAGTGLPVLPGSPGAHHTFPHGPLPNDNTTYCYAAFVEKAPGLVYSAGRFTRGRPFGLPFDTSPAPKWAFSTGATTMAPPGIGPAAYVASNDRALYAMVRGSGAAAGRWPAGFTPLRLSAPVQSRTPVVPTTEVPGASQVVFLGVQDGKVQAADALLGGPLPLWSNPLPGTGLQAAAAGMFTSLGGVFDYVLIGTWDTSGGNRFYALRVDDGSAWGAPFDNLSGGDGTGAIGVISGGAAVDYPGRRVYFASRRHGGGSQNALWCLNLTAAGLTFAWARDLLDDVDGSPVLLGGRVYVGTNSGKVIGVDAADGTNPWTFNTADGPVKGFVFPDRSGTSLYVATTNKVWGLTDGNATPNWPPISIPSPSIVLFRRSTTFVYAGGGDGRLYELNLLGATAGIPPSVKSVVLGDGLAGVGAPTLDVANDLIYVGSEAGVVYAVQAPLP